MKILLAAGADPRLTQENGNSPLLLAAGLGYRGPIGGTEAMALDAIAFSLEQGADINAVNAAGDTAVHVAATTNFNESGTAGGLAGDCEVPGRTRRAPRHPQQAGADGPRVGAARQGAQRRDRRVPPRAARRHRRHRRP